MVAFMAALRFLIVFRCSSAAALDFAAEWLIADLIENTSWLVEFSNCAFFVCCVFVFVVLFLCFWLCLLVDCG